MRSHRIGCLICFAAVVLFSSSASVRAGAEEAGKMNLSATLKYVEDWAARDAFPESPSFAYMNVFSRFALGGEVSEEDKSRIVEYIKKCRRPDGGFISDPEIGEGAAAASNIISTYFALATLDLLNASSAIDREKTADFILALAGGDGSIRLSANGRQSNLGTTYYGVRSLHLLNALERFDKNHAIGYIKSHLADDGGFGVLPGKPSAPQATFMAVESLNVLGGLTDDVGAGVARYLEKTPYSGLSEPGNFALMNMENMACVLETAALVSALPRFNSDRIKAYIESWYVPENGGFGPGQGLGTTPPSTFYALRCLVELGMTNFHFVRE